MAQFIRPSERIKVMEREYRTAEVWDGHRWRPIAFFNIKPYQRILLRESTGEKVVSAGGNTIFFIKSKARIDDEGFLYFEFIELQC